MSQKDRIVDGYMRWWQARSCSLVGRVFGCSGDWLSTSQQRVRDVLEALSDEWFERYAHLVEGVKE